MKVNLLFDGYKSNKNIFYDFKNDTISLDKDYFSEEFILIENAPDFPIYMGALIKGDKKGMFREAIITLMKDYIPLDRSIHLNENFWHSLLILEKREYIIDNYPRVLESYKNFQNIVFKNFDWENYIYKCVLAAEYIYDSEFINSAEDAEHYIHLIYENLDIYNYIIKYRLFRNSDFIIKFLTVIDQENLSQKMKAKLPEHPQLGKDERYGRLVFQELNNSYPVINSPALSIEELTSEINRILSMYD